MLRPSRGRDQWKKGKVINDVLLGGYDITTDVSLFLLYLLLYFALLPDYLVESHSLPPTSAIMCCATQAQSNHILDTTDTVCLISCLALR